MDTLTVTTTHGQSIDLTEVKKVSDANYAYCSTCDQIFDPLNALWPLSQTLWLHANGIGHKLGKEVKLYRLTSVKAA